MFTKTIPTDIIQHLNRVTTLNNEHNIVSDDLISGLFDALAYTNIDVAIAYAVVIKDMIPLHGLHGSTINVLDIKTQVHLRMNSILKCLRNINAEASRQMS